MNSLRTLIGVGLCAVAWVSAAHGEELRFDAVVFYNDARVDTVYDVWEYYNREPVRMLCYIDKDARPQIPYADISSISFKRAERDSRMVSITITLHDGTTKQGTLWYNDWIFGTKKDGSEWRERIASLARLALMPSKPSSPSSSAPPVQSRSHGGRH